MGNGYIKKSVFFLVIMLGSALLSALLVPYADALLVRLGKTYDLHRILSRIALLLILAGFITFRSRFRFKATLMPFLKKEKRFLSFGKGFFLGVLVLLVITTGALFTKVRIFAEDLTLWAFTAGFLKSMLTAVSVAFLETFLVWGVLFVYIKEDFGKKSAVIATSFLYAFAHFLRSEEIVRPETLDPFIGFKVLGLSFNNLLDFANNGYAALGLLLLGLFFSLLFVRSRFDLFIVAGVHAGAVFIIKLNMVVLDFLYKDYEWLFGTSTGIDSVAGWTLLLLLIILLLLKKSLPFIKQDLLTSEF